MALGSFNATALNNAAFDTSRILAYFNPTTAYILEVDAYVGTAVQTLRLATSSFITSPADTPANTFYAGRIVEAGSISREIGLGGIGQASANYVDLELNNASGALDPWLDYGFDGRSFQLKTIADGSRPIGAAQLIVKGTMAGLDGGDAMKTIRLQIRDRLSEIALPLLTTRYAGTTISGGLGTAEGNVDLTGQVKPRVFGSVVNVPGQIANPFELVWQFSLGAVSSIVVYDGGAALTPTSNYATLAALLAATIAPGSYATCLALGMARLGGSPALTVTADVVEGATLADRSAARVAQRMLALAGVAGGDIDTMSFDAAHTFNPAEVGIYIDDDRTALDAVRQVLDSVGVSLLPTLQGLFRAIPGVAPSGTPKGNLTERNLVSGGTTALVAGQDNGAPVWSVELTWGRVWRTMSAGEMAGSVSNARRFYLAQGTRKAVASDAAVKTRHLLAGTIAVDTLLTTAVDAQAEAARRLALFSVRRDRLSFPVLGDALYEIGDVVSVTLARFGYNSGKLFRVIGRSDDFSTRVVTLTLWG